MTYSLALSNGDLAVSGSRVDLARGRNKLIQDLDTWLRERYRVDRFNPNYGSTLQSYIGSVMSELSNFEIKSEVLRVLDNYQNNQIQRFNADPGLFTADELISEVVDVQIKAEMESIVITVSLRTVSGNTVNYTKGIAL